ncbi:MAG: class I SAM-dependent methyltransferase [Chloroflexi bacterium]|nr:class I SAM-dependent methyltransferase [Chloroflexota bacterium]
MTGDAGREAVREHYEELPYPARDPLDERRRLIQEPLAQLPLVDHLFWGGRRLARGGLRVLDAGCGTGDAVICLAEQLRGRGARIVAVDLSAASLAVAAKRARVRGLEGIEFVSADLEDLPSLGLGEFDYIVLPGVLQHLASPAEALRRLAGALAPDGGLGIRVYGRYGRTGVAQLREMLRLLAPPGEPTAARLRAARRVLGRLRPEHPARAYRDGWERELRDNGGADGSAALADLFLHPLERAYTVPELYARLGDAGLRLAAFDVPDAYEPRTYGVLDAEHLPPVERQALAELLNGRMEHHRLFAQRAEAPVLPPSRPNDASAVPAWARYDPGRERDRVLETGADLAVGTGEFARSLRLTPLAREILRRVDGRRSLGDILDEVADAPGDGARRRARREWERLYRDLAGAGDLLLNSPPDAGRLAPRSV